MYINTLAFHFTLWKKNQKTNEHQFPACRYLIVDDVKIMQRVLAIFSARLDGGGSWRPSGGGLFASITEIDVERVYCIVIL